VQTTFLVSARNGRNAQGKKLRAALLRRGARGAAVPCQPKPLTRAWMSAVADSLTQGDLARFAPAFNVRLTGSARNSSDGHSDARRISADASDYDDVPTCCAVIVIAVWDAVKTHSEVRGSLRQLERHRRADETCFSQVMMTKPAIIGLLLDHIPTELGPMPRPVLPGGALRCLPSPTHPNPREDCPCRASS
jgi:hypothetical protein